LTPRLLPIRSHDDRARLAGPHWPPTIAFDPQYHQNPRVEIASFINEPPGVVLDVGCGGGATGKLIKEKFPGTRVHRRRAQSPRGGIRSSAPRTMSSCASIDEVDLAQHVGEVAIGTCCCSSAGTPV
jgi:hypothetical protein